MPINNRIADFSGEMTTWRRHIHKNPETAFEEHKTSDFVALRLHEFGIEVHRGLAGTGVVGTLEGKKGKGPARSQTLITTAVGVLETLNDTAKTNSGVFFRTGDIDGPTFSTTEDPPLFEGRIDTSYIATVLS